MNFGMHMQRILKLKVFFTVLHCVNLTFVMLFLMLAILPVYDNRDLYMSTIFEYDILSSVRPPTQFSRKHA